MKSITKIFLSAWATILLAAIGHPQTGMPSVTQVEKPAKYSISPTELPAPFATESVRRPSKFVSQPKGAELKVPKGFKINLFAGSKMFDERSYPRMMALAPNGDVFVSDSRTDRILVFRDMDNDGNADDRFVFTEDTVQPFGLAFHKDWLYVANTDSVVRFKYAAGDVLAKAKPEKIADLPGKGYNQHWTRNIAISPDGTKIYVTVGSETNVSVEPDPMRAAVSVYDLDGSNHKIYANGLRNPVGLDFNPATGILWTAVNERDRLGDDLVPDYVTSLKAGGFYGFPYSYIGSNIDPRRKDDVKPDLVKRALVPDVLVASHSAALGLKFYDGSMFPSEYRGDLFVAFHGSWNRQKLTGYKVVRIKFDKDGRLETNAYEDFVSGWLPDENGNEVWGRPVGLLVLKDGSLLISDDNAKRIWRISYSGK